MSKLGGTYIHLKPAEQTLSCSTVPTTKALYPQQSRPSTPLAHLTHLTRHSHRQAATHRSTPTAPFNSRTQHGGKTYPTRRKERGLQKNSAHICLCAGNKGALPHRPQPHCSILTAILPPTRRAHCPTAPKRAGLTALMPPAALLYSDCPTAPPRGEVIITLPLLGSQLYAHCLPQGGLTAPPPHGSCVAGL